MARLGGALSVALLVIAGFQPAVAQDLDGEPIEAPTEGAAWVEPVNALCPVTTDEPIEDDIYLDIDGERIGFCCKKCKRKYAADPDFYAAGLAEVRLVARVDDASVNMGHDDLGHGDMQHSETEQAAAAAVDTDGGHADGESHDDHDEASEEHDHATGHGDPEDGLFDRLLVLVGKLHPLAVHLPIGLGIFAAIAEGLFMLKRDRAWRTTAIAAMLFAALGALAAAPLGWLAASGADFPRSLDQTLEWHRYAGLAALTWLLVGAYATREAREGEGRLFRVIALGAPVLIGLAGHLGGTLVFGVGYFAL